MFYDVANKLIEPPCVRLDHLKQQSPFGIETKPFSFKSFNKHKVLAKIMSDPANKNTKEPFTAKISDNSVVN